MKKFAWLGHLAVLLLTLASGLSMAQPVLNRDYQLITPPQPTSSGSKVEVDEFFWYGCIHCYHLEPSLKTWLKKKPVDVEFRYVPAIFDMSSWGPLARYYYTVEAMGIAEKYHDDIFNAIHRDNKRALVTDPRAMADWLASKGVDKQKFLDTYNSFAVNSKTLRSADLTRTFDIPGTPTLIVNGKYLTAPSMIVNAKNEVDYDRFFQVVDQLIGQARKDMAASTNKAPSKDKAAAPAPKATKK